MKIFFGCLTVVFGAIAFGSMLAGNWTAGVIFSGLTLWAIFMIPEEKWHYEGSTHHFRKR